MNKDLSGIWLKKKLDLTVKMKFKDLKYVKVSVNNVLIIQVESEEQQACTNTSAAEASRKRIKLDFKFLT
jgi:hypothetical protein